MILTIFTFARVTWSLVKIDGTNHFRVFALALEMRLLVEMSELVIVDIVQVVTVKAGIVGENVLFGAAVDIIRVIIAVLFLF